MARWSKRKLAALLAREWRSLTTINPSDRPWQMAIAAALASGLPLIVAAYFDHLSYGVIGSLGGLVFLYLPNTPLHHRIVVMLACSFALTGSYAFGLIADALPILKVPVLGLIAFVVTAAARFYRIGAPGPVFFVMVASIGAYTPGVLADAPLKIGLLALGALLAVQIAIIYSIFILRLRGAQPVMALPTFRFGFVIADSVIIGAAVAASLALAQVLQLDRPYWAPISCLAVIQGLSLRAVWTRQVHRLLGTLFGLVIAGVLLSFPLNAWSLALMVIVLTFIVENAITRHYGFAVMFITPLALFLAEAPTLGHTPIAHIMLARLEDTLVGCAVGFAGAVCLHNAGIRNWVGHMLRKVYPQRILH